VRGQKNVLSLKQKNSLPVSKDKRASGDLRFSFFYIVSVFPNNLTKTNFSLKSWVNLKLTKTILVEVIFNKLFFRFSF
jgi:hypothetical protein